MNDTLDIAGLTYVDRLAVACMAADDDLLLHDALRLYRQGLGGEHLGDCTKVATTCARCLSDEYAKKAAKVIHYARWLDVSIEEGV